MVFHFGGDDFTLGKAIYLPFLTEANIKAMLDSNMPFPTVNSDNNNQTIIIASAVLAVAAILVAAVLLLRKRNGAHKHSTPNA